MENNNAQIILKKKENLDAKLALAQGEKCDKYDYLISAFCGVSCGLIDAFLVGKPNFKDVENSKLGVLTDKAANKFTDSIANRLISRDAEIVNKLKKQGLKGEALSMKLEELGIPSNFPRRKDPPYPEFKDKITYLENKYRVSYDQSTNNRISSNKINITPDNHHLKSLAHCPDVIGLFFAILDQFTIKTTFVDNGQIIRAIPVNNRIELRGSDFFSKLFCAFCNWIGHLLSDFCGSHNSKGRGDGIPIPFFEIFQFCDCGDFTSPNGNYTIASLAMDVYQNGYDARFGMALAIPVLLNDLMVRFIWALKKHFYEKKKWKDCIPTKKHSDLRIMLLVSNSMLCITDGIDAGVKSGGNILELCLHLNLIAWFTLIKRALKELKIHTGFTYEDLLVQYQFIDLQLDIYIDNLKSIDYDKYEALIEISNSILNKINSSNSESAINEELSSYIRVVGINVNFKNDDEFDAIVLDSNSSLSL